MADFAAQVLAQEHRIRLALGDDDDARSTDPVDRAGRRVARPEGGRR